MWGLYIGRIWNSGKLYWIIWRFNFPRNLMVLFDQRKYGWVISYDILRLLGNGFIIIFLEWVEKSDICYERTYILPLIAIKS